MINNKNKPQKKKSSFTRTNSKKETLHEAKEKILALSRVVLDRKSSQNLRVESLKEALTFDENVISIKERLALINNLLNQKDLVSPYYLGVKTIEKEVRQNQKSKIILKIEEHITQLQLTQESFDREKYSEIQAKVRIFREAEMLGSNSFKGAGRHHFFWTYVVLQKYLETVESNSGRHRHENNEFLRILEPLVTLKYWNKFEQGSRKAKTMNCMVYPVVFGIYNDVDFSDDACRAVLTFGNEMAGNFDQRVIFTETFITELKIYESQRSENLQIKDDADRKLREEFQRHRNNVLRQYPLGSYYGEGFVNNRWG
jgi:hypothetical protein